MDIKCSGCGREYDVTLFSFGRTIHCTCGHRVGLEHRIAPEVPSGQHRFIADAMLGRLARWLRTLGFDTAYDEAISDTALVRRALQEGRHILTRDRRLFEEWRVEGGLQIQAERPMDQLAEVVTAFDLPRPKHLFTRCRICNGTLEPIRPEAVADRVPPRVLERQDRFSTCRECGRVYWEGTHAERMRSLLTKLFDDRSGQNPVSPTGWS